VCVDRLRQARGDQAFRAAFSAIPDVPFASRELGAHVVGAEPVARQQNEAMEPQVRHLGDHTQSITVLRRHDRLGRLLADLLEDRVVALGEELGDVGRRRIGPSALRDHRGDPIENIASRRWISHGRRSPRGP
jgi:hypothetical protein